jgi:hypothetical protein
MDVAGWYQLAADAMLVVHGLFIAFVIAGFVAILIGLGRAWVWTGNRWFRLLHLCAIGIVVLQAWLGRACPLTVWEAALRRRAGQLPQEGSFVQYWLHRLIFFEAEAWVFGAAYTAFGLAVLIVYLLAPPRWSEKAARKPSNDGS